MFFINERIGQLQFSEKESKDHSVASVAKGNSVATINPNYLKAKSPSLRFSILIHEARHAENDGWDHAICPKNLNLRSEVTGLSLAGLEACEFYSLGAYGVQIVFLANIGKYATNLSSDEKDNASKYSKSLMDRVINPIQKALLLDDLKL